MIRGVNKEIAIQLLLLLTIVSLAIFIFYSLRMFTNAFLGALILYVFTKPLMKLLTGPMRLNKYFSATVVILLSFTVIILPAIFLVDTLYSRFVNFFSNSSVLLQSQVDLLNKITSGFGIKVISESTIENLKQKGTELITNFLGETAVSILSLLILYFLLFFLLINTGKMEKWLMRYLPMKEKNIKILSDELELMTFSNVLGAPLVALIQAGFAILGYWMFSVPNPVFWGFLTGFFSLVPFIGSALIWIPAGAYLLSIGATWQGIAVLIYGFTFISYSDNVFRFILQKKFANVHPVITVLGVVFGLNVFGIAGIIIGPLLISYLIILSKIYHAEYIAPLKE